MITKKSFKKEWKNLIFNGLFALLTIIIVIAIHNNILSATILLVIISAIGLIKWNSKITLAMFLFGSLFGAFSEMIAINYGIWSYTTTNFINIPTWLFLVWGNTAAFLYQTGLEIKKIGVKE